MIYSTLKYCLLRTSMGAIAIVACWLPLFVGCGHSGPLVVPVDGVITYGGGRWPTDGVLYFVLAESTPGVAQRPALAHFDTNGHITVKSFKEGDGLVPGTYRVGVECWEVPPMMASGKPAKSYVPAKYQSPTTSGFEVVVKPDARRVEVQFDVPKG